MNYNFINFQRGFTLTQTLVSLGIVSVIALAVAGVIASAIEGSSQQRAFNTAEEAIQLISGLMGDSDYCTKHFMNISIPNTVPAIIASAIQFKDIAANGELGGTIIIGQGGKFQNVITINSITLQVTQSLGGNRYLGNLNLEMVSSTKASNRYYRSIPIFMAKNAAGNLTSCSKFSQPAHGASQGVYSFDCEDFASKGWSSKLSCMQDGRWHIAFSHNQAGNPIIGSKASLISHIQNGASVKVGIPDGTYGLAGSGELCSSVAAVQSPNHVACMGAERRGVSDWSALTVTDPGHVAVYFSSGKVYLPGLGYVYIPLNWIIKY